MNRRRLLDVLVAAKLGSGGVLLSELRKVPAASQV
jgi:hypothetical protein